MSMWTAPSDLDYYEEMDPREERDPEYEQWLEEHGYLEPVEGDAFEAFAREQWERSNPVLSLPEEDIPF